MPSTGSRERKAQYERMHSHQFYHPAIEILAKKLHLKGCTCVLCDPNTGQKPSSAPSERVQTCTCGLREPEQKRSVRGADQWPFPHQHVTSWWNRTLRSNGPRFSLENENTCFILQIRSSPNGRSINLKSLYPYLPPW